MSTQSIKINPGVDVEKSPLLNEAGWSSCQMIRFFQGLLSKIGGWQKFFQTAVTGTCRGMFANQDLSGNQYLALGTNSNLQVYINNNLSDITPISSTSNDAVPFSTASGQKTINFHEVGNPAQVGEFINVLTPTAIGGLVLQGLYAVSAIVDSDNYTIMAASNATSTVSGAGSTALFTTTNTLSSVQVTLANHGFSVGSAYTIYVSTTVGGIVLFGTYVVATYIDVNNFTIVAASSATSSTNGHENGGNVRIVYLLEAGLVSAGTSSGWGIGYWGFGPWGIGASSGGVTPLREWHFGAWGEDLIANYTNGGIYIWLAAGGAINNPAAIIPAAPLYNTSVFIAMPQQQIVALGAEVGGTQDPLLVRWCDVADYTDWTATVINQAGSFRIPSGSRIVGGIQGPQQGLIWTDTSLWAMQYVQPPFVYGFNQIGSGCGLIASRAMGTLNSAVYWMGIDGFYEYSGTGVLHVPCSVWDKVFQNLNLLQKGKITCAPNSSFNEITWYYPSNAGTGEVDSYVKYNADTNVWDYGSLVRTAWIDQSIFGQPMGVDENGYVQQHETSNDADGSPLVCFAETGLFKISAYQGSGLFVTSEGQYYIFLERLLPDFVLSPGATVQVTVKTYGYASDTPVVSGPFQVTSATEYIIVRARGRFASIRIASSDAGSFWRLGECLYSGSPAGRR